ncbi:hypothetical protein B0T14DRAFT_508481 [Immersiella caudata]|uniref:Uncharacterized protein n=1 Tax=Immersiella caudata TaxID=314043 RepID=A0AA39XHL2_9PEZI|nr:hypothetical protein B0T14DRAFT_508481 [Immersiella caudata]
MADITTYSTRTTSLLPLTTIFTPPASCQAQLPTFPPVFIRDPSSASGVRIDLYMDFDSHLLSQLNYNFEAAAHPECYPDSWANTPYIANPGIYLHTGYSPGVCPSDYIKEFQTSQGTRTWAACCSPPPKDWRPSALATFCAYKVTTPIVALTWRSDVTDYRMLSRTSPTITTTLTPAESTSIYVIGIHVAVMWESKDLPLPRAAVTATSITPFESVEGTPPTSSNSATGGSESIKLAGLQNPGSVAAVALGAVIGIALILGGMVFWRRWRQKRTLAVGNEVRRRGEGERKVELQITMVGSPPPCGRTSQSEARQMKLDVSLRRVATGDISRARLFSLVCGMCISDN